MFARALLMIASKVVAHVAFLLIGVVLARSLDRAEFGTFNQVWLINKSLLYLFEFGLPVSVYYFLPRLAIDRRKGFILQTLVSLTIFAVPFSLVLYLLADPLAVQFNNPALADHLRLFAFYPLVILPTVSTEEILLSLGHTGSAALFESLSKITMISAVAVAAIVGQQLDWVFKSLILYGIVQSLLGLWLVWQPVKRLKLVISWPEWRSQITYALPYGFSALIGALNYQVDKVLVSSFNPPAAFAIYAAGAFEIPLGGVTSLPVVSVMMGDLTQKFAAGDIEGFLALWHQSMRKLALPIFAVILFLMVFAEPVVTGLFSQTYVESVGPFRIYLLFSPLRITVLDYVLVALGETKAVLKAQLMAMVGNIVLGYLLLHSVGWMGAAVAAVIAGYLFAILLILKIRQRLRVSLVQIAPWADLAKVGGVAVIAGMGCLPVLALPLSAIAQLLLGGVVFSTIYLLGSLSIKAITVAEIQAGLQWGAAKLKGAMGKTGDRPDV